MRAGGSGSRPGSCAGLGSSVRLYAWLLETRPKEWTHRYATFIRPDLNLNFVLLVSDGKTLHHDTLYHLGVAVPDRAAVIDACHRATRFGAPVEKAPRTTWKGTPLHELWLTDPDGNLIEIYARLMDAAMPFERIRKLDEEFDQMTADFAKAFAGMAEKEVEALVDEAVKTVRRKPSRK